MASEHNIPMDSIHAGYYIGILSGTSIDNIDCVIIKADNLQKDKPRLIATYTHDIPEGIKSELHNLINNKSVSLEEFGKYNRKLGHMFSDAINNLLNKHHFTADQITAIGFHGQTVFHQPEAPYSFSMQLGCASTIRELTHIPVISDLRQRDMINGGQGAPLAPLIHKELLSDPNTNRAIVNLGGICNITLLLNNTSEQDITISSDLGPANTLLDQNYRLNYKNNGQKYDKNGEWANTGSVDEQLLNSLLTDSYFSKTWPKSTGREYFNMNWLNNYVSQLQNKICSENLQRTLLELTAKLISDFLANYNQNNKANTITELYLCGGGVHNILLYNRISQLCSKINISTHPTDVLGYPADWLEGMLFAWLAFKAWHKQQVNLKNITGNKNTKSLLGCIYY